MASKNISCELWCLNNAQRVQSVPKISSTHHTHTHTQRPLHRITGDLITGDLSDFRCQMSWVDYFKNC